jgi:hypothetical protein
VRKPLDKIEPELAAASGSGAVNRGFKQETAKLQPACLGINDQFLKLCILTAIAHCEIEGLRRHAQNLAIDDGCPNFSSTTFQQMPKRLSSARRRWPAIRAAQSAQQFEAAVLIYRLDQTNFDGHAHVS